MRGWTACSRRSRRRRARGAGRRALVRYEILLLGELGFGLDEERVLAAAARIDARRANARIGGRSAKGCA